MDNKRMRGLLLSLSVFFFASTVNAQLWQGIYTPYQYDHIAAKKSALIPTGCGAPTGLGTILNNKLRQAGLYFDSCAKKIYIFSPTDTTWGEISPDDKLNISDTSEMLAPYLHEIDTTSMLQAYARLQRFLDSCTALRNSILSSIVHPGGSNRYVQFNDNGVFGGNLGFQFDKALANAHIGSGSYLMDGFYSLTVGHQDTLRFNGSQIAVGTGNYSQHNSSFLAGNGVKFRGAGQFNFGIGLRDTILDGESSFVGGRDNKIMGANDAFAFGSNNLIKASGAYGIGNNLIGKFGNSFIIGRYNDTTERRLFSIGNGIAGARKDAFAVDTLGRVIVDQMDAGTSTDEIVVRNSTDKKLKVIPQSSLANVLTGDISANGHHAHNLGSYGVKFGSEIEFDASREYIGFYVDGYNGITLSGSSSVTTQPSIRFVDTDAPGADARISSFFGSLQISSNESIYKSTSSFGSGYIILSAYNAFVNKGKSISIVSNGISKSGISINDRLDSIGFSYESNYKDTGLKYKGDRWIPDYGAVKYAIDSAKSSITAPLSSTYIGVGDGSNVLSGSSAFTYDATTVKQENSGAVNSLISTTTLGASSGGVSNIYAKSLPTASTDRLGIINFGSAGGATNDYIGASISGFANGSWTGGSSHFSRLIFSTTNSGSSTPSEVMRISNSRVSIGTGITGTAYLTLRAGTSGANGAPLKFTSGTNQVTPEAGAVEFDGQSFFFTPSTTRLRAILSNNVIPGAGQVAVGNGNDYTVSDVFAITTVTATGTTTLSGTIKMHTIKIDATSGNVTVTITANHPGQVVNVKRMDNSGNTITVQGSSGNIDGSTSITLTSQYQSAQLQWDASNWIKL